MASKSIDTLLNISKDDMKKVNQIIIDNMKSDVPLIPELAGYLISAGGKRLRPMLTCITANMCGDKTGFAPLYASCVEFIHTATLLHDDVVDESDIRRGKESANTVWGNQAAVLVGDFLFSRAFQLMSNAGKTEATKVLSDASARLAEGEILQLLTTNDITTSKESYLEMIGAKTAVLFASACKVGAVLSEKDEDTQQKLYEYGQNLGVAFQMIDDALDYDVNNSEIDKNIGDDFKEGKITIPLIVVRDNGNDEEQEFLKRTIVEQNQNKDDLSTMLGYIEKYNAINETFEMAKLYGQKAKDCLNIFPDSDYKTALIEAVDYAIKRAK